MSNRRPNQSEAGSPAVAENFRHGSGRIAVAAARHVFGMAQAETAPRERKPGQNKSAARFFTPAQHTLVEELSETIIPADSHSGGAKAAKVADYIEQFLRETSDDNQKSHLAGRASPDRSDEPALQRKIFR